MNQVMVVHPHDGYDEKTEPVADKHRRHFPQCRQRRLRGCAQLQHHDRDNNGDHAIAESFETAGGHFTVGHDENLAHGRRENFRLEILDF